MMRNPSLPLAEIFGFPADDVSPAATRFRTNRLCPYNNKVPNCTKDKANDPLGVCSILHAGEAVITCPVRFREQWLITEDAASFFFDQGAKWSSLTEVRLNDAGGKTAGNIDIVLVSYDDTGKILDFGSIEIQAVYITGNVRAPFERFMEGLKTTEKTGPTDESFYVRPDYLSSSRKRLAPQMLFKGGILQSWKKKMAIVLHSGFFRTLPPMTSVHKEEADLAWLVYDLVKENENGYRLVKSSVMYTRFEEALPAITQSQPGKLEDFMSALQRKLDIQQGAAPANKTIDFSPE